MSRRTESSGPINTVARLGELSAERMDQQMRLLEISSMLHRKLDLPLLLECFFTECQSFLSFEGLSFTVANSHETIMVGDNRQHLKHYPIQLAGESLGQLTVHTAQVLSPKDQRQMDRLILSIEYPLKNALDYRVAERATLVDPSTGIFNRKALERELPREMLISKRSEIPLSLLILDLDHFHRINESHGYAVGDELIQEVANTLNNNLREADVIFRLEPDSFAVILGETDFDGALTVSERLRTSIDTCYRYNNIQLLQNASAGVTEMSEADTASSLIERAQAALIQAKRAGRNRIRSLHAEEVVSQS